MKWLKRLIEAAVKEAAVSIIKDNQAQHAKHKVVIRNLARVVKSYKQDVDAFESRFSKAALDACNASTSAAISRAEQAMSKEFQLQVKRIEAESMRHMQNVEENLHGLAGKLAPVSGQFNRFLEETSKLIPGAIDTGVSRAVDRIEASKNGRG